MSLSSSKLAMSRRRAAVLFLLQAPVPWLVVLSTWLHSWDVIYLESLPVTSFNATEDHITSVRLSPDGLCLDQEDGNASCQSFIDILFDTTLTSHRTRRHHHPTDLTTHEPFDVAATIDAVADAGARELDQVLSSWCRPQGSTVDEVSLLTQGAESAVCLALVETCLFSLALWTTFASVSALMASASVLTRKTVAAADSTCAVFCSYANALLGIVVIVLWWSYRSFMVDVELLSSMSLSWRFGGSFYAVCGALVLSLVSLRIHTKAFSPNYAQLHALPPANSRGDQAPQACRRPQNPLDCPANYVV